MSVSTKFVLYALRDTAANTYAAKRKVDTLVELVDSSYPEGEDDAERQVKQFKQEVREQLRGILDKVTEVEEQVEQMRTALSRAQDSELVPGNVASFFPSNFKEKQVVEMSKGYLYYAYTSDCVMFRGKLKNYEYSFVAGGVGTTFEGCDSVLLGEVEMFTDKGWEPRSSPEMLFGVEDSVKFYERA